MSPSVLLTIDGVTSFPFLMFQSTLVLRFVVCWGGFIAL